MEKKRILWIDALKGICALIVVMSHICAVFKYACPAIMDFRVTPVLGLIVNGNFAVYIFIMLSTMLMYGRVFETEISLSKIGSIIRKRYFRLSLPIAVVYVISLIMKLCGLFYHITLGEKYGFDWLIIDRQEYSSFPLGILLSVLGNSCGWFNVMWMMKYIFIGSVFAICLGISLKELQTRKRLFYISLLSLLSYFIDCYYCAVFAGCLLHEIMTFMYRNTSKRMWTRVLSAGALGGAIFIGEYFYSSDIIGLKNLFESITLIAFIIVFPKIQDILSTPFFLWFGKISYEIFLVHLLVIYSASSYLYLYLPRFDGLLVFITIITIMLTIFAAWIISKYLSSKMNGIVSKYA